MAYGQGEGALVVGFPLVHATYVEGDVTCYRFPRWGGIGILKVQLGRRGPFQGLVRPDLRRPPHRWRCAEGQAGRVGDGARRQLQPGTPKEGWDYSTP